MAGKKSNKGKGSFATYKTLDVCKKNRTKKLAQHLKLHPKDEQAKEANKSVRGYIRTASKVKRWNAESRWMAQIESTLRGFWKHVANGGSVLPSPQPEFLNYGVAVPVPLKHQKPKPNKKREQRTRVEK